MMADYLSDAMRGNAPPGILASPSREPLGFQTSGQEGVLFKQNPYMPSTEADQLNVPVGKVNPGFWGRIRQTPGAADGLLAFGQQMLSAPGFLQGLGNGAQAFGQTLDSHRQKARPKTEFLANGAIQAATDPQSGRTTYQRTPVADYTADLETRKAGNRFDYMAAQEDRRDGRFDKGLEVKRDLALQTDGTKRWVATMQDGTKRYVSDTGNTNDLQIARIASGDRRYAVDHMDARQATKPLPAAIQKQFNESSELADNLDGSLQQLGPILQDLKAVMDL